MSVMHVGADTGFRAAPVRKPGFFEILGASIRLAGAVNSHRPADPRDLEIIGLDESFNDRLRESYRADA
jgi:hypothetical protein